MRKAVPSSRSDQTRVDARHYTLVAELIRILGDNARIHTCRGIDANLARIRLQHWANVLNVLNPASDCQRNKAVGREGDHREKTCLCRRKTSYHIHEDEFVAIALVVDTNRRKYRTDSTPTVETDSFDKTKIAHQESRNDPHLQHDAVSAKFLKSPSPARELFSA
jgi:hypothetical protein